ncbi:hypothetical protein SESBI_49250 [Sesbania bispinosa]|nr:hypothetical protein SESBI_49250 [Sesbania bispinosa]
MECLSHGQSQMLKAAMPLHKAMEYETAPAEMPPVRAAPSTPKHCFMTDT